MKLGIVKSVSDCGSIYYRFYCYEFNKEVWEKEKNNVILNKDIKFCEYIEFSELEVLKEKSKQNKNKHDKERDRINNLDAKSVVSEFTDAFK